VLQGSTKILNTKGTFEWKFVERDHQYSDAVVLWMQTKLRSVVNKNTYLSRIDKPAEMYAILWSIQKSFLIELATRFKEFGLTPPQIIELSEIHLNAVEFAIRRAVYADDKAFLTSTTQETTQKVQQNITQESEKKGLFGFFR
jgi:hypothetical protein